MNIHNDQQLVKQLLKGDERSYTLFFNDYFPRLFQFSRTRLWHNEDYAEEAVQNAMTKAVQKLSSYRGEAALFTWLCTFCRHEISAIVKREKKREGHMSLPDENDVAQAELASMALTIAQDPIEHYRKKELTSLVHMAKTHIPSLYSDLLEWKYLHGYSIREMAEKIDRTPKATESLLTRARLAFKEAFSILTAADNNTSGSILGGE